MFRDPDPLSRFGFDGPPSGSDLFEPFDTDPPAPGPFGPREARKPARGPGPAPRRLRALPCDRIGHLPPRRPAPPRPQGRLNRTALIQGLAIVTVTLALLLRY